jgi:hypothetical protein
MGHAGACFGAHRALNRLTFSDVWWFGNYALDESSSLRE